MNKKDWNVTVDTHDCDHTSVCCGAGVAEWTDISHDAHNSVGFCAACRDATEFECNQCSKERE